MIRFEMLCLVLGRCNGSFDDPESRAFKLRNPLLLKTYRPEKKFDSENYRIFTSLMGGFKAGIADLQAKCSGKNHRLSSENTLKDLLAVYGFSNEATARKIILFLRRALCDESVSVNTPIGWFQEVPSSQTEQVPEETVNAGR